MHWKLYRQVFRHLSTLFVYACVCVHDCMCVGMFTVSNIMGLFPVPPHVHIHFVVPPPGCGRSVTDFWGWGAHRVQLRCPDYVSNDMYERGVPGGALNLNSTDYPDMVAMGIFSCKEKFPLQNRESNPERLASSQKFWLPSLEAGLYLI
jgi:hypothetical protein